MTLAKRYVFYLSDIFKIVRLNKRLKGRNCGFYFKQEECHKEKSSCMSPKLDEAYYLSFPLWQESRPNDDEIIVRGSTETAL